MLSENSNTFASPVFSPPLFNDKLSLSTVRSAPAFQLTGFVYILAEDYAVVYGLARRRGSFGSCVSGKTFPGMGCLAVLTTWLLLGVTSPQWLLPDQSTWFFRDHLFDLRSTSTPTPTATQADCEPVFVLTFSKRCLKYHQLLNLFEF